MSDQLDQISEAQAYAQQIGAPRTTHTYTFVFQAKGRWVSATFEGPLSECNEAFEQAVAAKGVLLEKVRWARGYKDGNRTVVHPKTDAAAEAEVLKVMGRNPKPTPVGRS